MAELRRNVNRAHHACGCVTVFDTIGWRSVLVDTCDSHRAVLSANPEGQPDRLGADDLQ